MFEGRGRWAMRFASLAAAGLVGCAFAKEMGVAAGEGALEGFSTFVYEKDAQNSWGNSWEVSGRGVGVGTRAAAPQSLDCSAVNDEFMELYDAKVLQRLASYVPTVDGALSAERFDTLRKTPFRMSGERHGGVIGVVQTDAGRLAKFVARFGPDEAEPTLELHDVTVLDPATGAVLRHSEGPLQLPSRVAIDLDGGQGQPRYDLRFGPDPAGVPTLAAAAGAGLSFPAGSLCEGSGS